MGTFSKRLSKAARKQVAKSPDTVEAYATEGTEERPGGRGRESRQRLLRTRVLGFTLVLLVSGCSVDRPIQVQTFGRSAEECFNIQQHVHFAVSAWDVKLPGVFAMADECTIGSYEDNVDIENTNILPDLPLSEDIALSSVTSISMESAGLNDAQVRGATVGTPCDIQIAISDIDYKVISHELAHTLGLQHVRDELNVAHPRPRAWPWRVSPQQLDRAEKVWETWQSCDDG